MSRYITTEYNYGSMIPSAAQIAARVSTLHNGLRPVTAAIIAESYGLQPSEIQAVLNQAKCSGLLRHHHMYGWIQSRRWPRC